jgi:hypothetical protein
METWLLQMEAGGGTCSQESHYSALRQKETVSYAYVINGTGSVHM